MQLQITQLTLLGEKDGDRIMIPTGIMNPDPAMLGGEVHIEIWYPGSRAESRAWCQKNFPGVTILTMGLIREPRRSGVMVVTTPEERDMFKAMLAAQGIDPGAL